MQNIELALRARANRLRHNYNLTVEEAELIYQFQGNVCAICKKPQRSGKRLAIDHCHKTGLIRGALCSQCNRIIGRLENHGWTIERLLALIEYWSHPPAEKALGRRVYGFPGRCGTKRHKLAIRLQKQREKA